MVTMVIIRLQLSGNNYGKFVIVTRVINATLGDSVAFDLPLKLISQTGCCSVEYLFRPHIRCYLYMAQTML